MAEPARVDALNRLFHYILDRACMQVTKEVNLALKRLSITNRHYLVLVVIRDNNGIIQQEVSAVLDFNQNVILQLMDDLDKLGLATRQRNPQNRRQHLLALTHKGEKVLIQAHKIIDETYDRCLPMAVSKRKEITEALSVARCSDNAVAAS